VHSFKDSHFQPDLVTVTLFSPRSSAVANLDFYLLHVKTFNRIRGTILTYQWVSRMLRGYMNWDWNNAHMDKICDNLWFMWCHINNTNPSIKLYEAPWLHRWPCSDGGRDYRLQRCNTDYHPHTLNPKRLHAQPQTCMHDNQPANWWC